MSQSPKLFRQNPIGRLVSFIETTASEIHWFYYCWIDPIVRVGLWVFGVTLLLVAAILRFFIMLPILFIRLYLALIGFGLGLIFLFMIGKFLRIW
ncbi:hypothetical protein AEYBE204_09750 [Asticcacaulis sp. YBE204]|nr:hypothetical protein AEYBE204_09750 [Asticcacaulis sp. YBE204]